jgi:hypothetical protein
MRNIREVLEDGGRAIVLVPYGPWLTRTPDEALGHQRRYTRNQLKELAETAGFHLDIMLEFKRIGVIAWWINGKLLRRHTFGFWQIKRLNLLTPLFRVLDKFLPLPPLSLIAVLSTPNRKGVETPVGSSLAPVGPA